MKILLNNEKITKKSVFSDISNNEKYNKLENSIFFNQGTRSSEISLQELKYLLENKDIFDYSYELTNKSIQNLKESNFLTSKLMGNVCENVEIFLSLDLIKNKINQVKNKSDSDKSCKIKP